MITTSTVGLQSTQGPCPTGYHVPTNAEWDIADAAALGSEMELMVLVQRVGITTLQKPLTLILNFLRLVIVIVPMDCLTAKVLTATTGVVL